MVMYEDSGALGQPVEEDPIGTGTSGGAHDNTDPISTLNMQGGEDEQVLVTIIFLALSKSVL